LSDESIRAVLFDVDGTLYAPTLLRLAMACEMGVLCTASLLRGDSRVPSTVRAFRTCRESLRTRACSSEPLARRQYSLAAERLGCAPAAVEEVVHEWMYRRPLKWLPYCRRPGVLELLTFLEMRGVRRGVFSDYPAHDKLAALGLAGRFDLVVSAVDADIDAFKPDPRGYLAAAERWGVTPASVLYVGDRVEVDATGAAAAGMRCALLGRTAGSTATTIGVRHFAELQRALADLC
jgi:HAD superfamily hydrolase (TIGR01509 family)